MRLITLFCSLIPPYFNADQDKFYTHSFDKESHYRLERVLRAHRHRFQFLLTYDNSPEIREMYHWSAQILDKTWNYTINRTDDQTKKSQEKGKRSMGREIFITNYDAVASLPVQLTLEPTVFGLMAAS